MVRLLLQFSQVHIEFRAAEWKSICEFNGLSKYANFIDDCQDPLIVVDFDSLDDVRLLSNRCVLLKSAYELLHDTNSHDEMIKWLNDGPSILKEFDVKTESWCLRIRSVGKKRSCDYVNKMLREYVDSMKIDNAEVDLVGPTIDLSIIENVKHGQAEPYQVFFARLIGHGQGRLKHEYSIKERRYIGNTTMDAELSFIQANMSSVQAGDLVVDPFCGTCGLLIAAAHFKGFVLGTEINYMVARAKGKSSRQYEGDLRPGYHSILANFEQYGLSSQFLSVILSDASQKSMWKKAGLFDVIITDPPYGVRERYRKRRVYLSQENRYPEKEKYELINSYVDLMDFAAEYLKIGGHISYWFPVLRKSYSTSSLPLNECLELLYNCEQVLNYKCSRRLLVYRKTKEFNSNAISSIKEDSSGINTFRDVYFKPAGSD